MWDRTVSITEEESGLNCAMFMAIRETGQILNNLN
jgi:hypothetical protein